jgi:multiple sugar transport system permease protein
MPGWPGDLAILPASATPGRAERAFNPGKNMLSRVMNNSNVLGLIFMLPLVIILVLFLTYPLGLGIWLGFTDAKIGRAGEWIGLGNYAYLIGDSVSQLALFNTIFYTVIASILKFILGLWLALLLNKNLPFKAFFRSVVLLPWIVPTALSALAFWWIYDAQFSIISWTLVKLGLIDTYINFLGDPWMARYSTIFANVWRGIPFVAITLLAGLQTISPALYEAASIDGVTPWQQFRYVTLPLLTPIIAVVMTFSVLFTFTDFQLIYVLTRGGPLNATHLMTTLSFQRAIPGGSLGEGAALAIMMIPFLLAAIMFSYFGLQRRAWQRGEDK